MTRKIILLSLGVMMVLFLGLKFFTSSKQAAITITSDDSNVQLNIPKNALPKGAKIQDIRITKVVDTDTDVLANYKLAPDGLTFVAPVDISITANIKGENIPKLFLVAGSGEFQPIENQKIFLDSKESKVLIKGSLRHFSDLMLVNHFFKESITTPSDHLIGESFDVTFSLTKVRDKYVFERFENGKKIYEYHAQLLYPWQVKDGKMVARKPLRAFEFFGSESDIVQPVTIENLPESESMDTKRNWLTVKGTFKCILPGTAHITYHATLWGKESYYYIEFKDKPKEGEHRQQEGVASISFATGEFECLPPPTSEQKQLDTENVEVLVLNGKLYPSIQFRVANPDLCGEKHYHSNRAVVSLDYVLKEDPKPEGCGYGKVSEVRKTITPMSKKDWETFKEKAGLP